MAYFHDAFSSSKSDRKKSHIKISNTKRKRLNTKFYGCHDMKKNEIFFAAIYFAGKISLSNSCRSHFVDKKYIYI